jgi:hypothetical protein
MGRAATLPFKLGWKDPERFLRLHDCSNQNPFLNPVQLLPSLKPAPRKSQGVQGATLRTITFQLVRQNYFNVATKTRTMSRTNRPNILVEVEDKTSPNTTHLSTRTRSRFV